MEKDIKSPTEADSVKPEITSKDVKLNFDIPDLKELLKTGAQFGHQTNKWNPKMESYIFGQKSGVHIIDLSKTLPLLEKALKFLVKASQSGTVLFVATKKQASDIVKNAAIESGSYYIIHRWPGGFFTNKGMINRSIKKLQKLESDFEKGIEGRTKFEIMVMKKEWSRLNRLYEGVKTIAEQPKAIVVIDTNYERKAIREAQRIGIPVVAILDSNCDPEGIQYPIPANDDAVKSIESLIGLVAKAVKQGNEGKGVRHNLVDYSKVEVKIIKTQGKEEENVAEVVIESKTESKPVEKVEKKAVKKTRKKTKDSEEKGILGKAREASTKSRVKIKRKSSK